MDGSETRSNGPSVCVHNSASSSSNSQSISSTMPTTSSSSSSSSSSSTTSIAHGEPGGRMVLRGCPRCLMYVIVLEQNQRCPRCYSTSLLHLFS